MQPFKYRNPVNTGNLRHRITIQKFEDGVNENGFPVQTWIDVKSVWADLKTVKGSEFYQAASAQAQNDIRFIIRYTTGVNSDMRISYKDRLFNIISIINDDERNKTLTIIGREVI